MEYATIKFTSLEEATEHPLKPVIITVRYSFIVLKEKIVTLYSI